MVPFPLSVDKERCLYEEDARTERELDLIQMLSSSGWKGIAVPQIHERIAKTMQQMARGRDISLDEIRFMQGKVQALQEIVAKPKSYFLGRSIEEPATDL
jgi:hypothetical protein